MKKILILAVLVIFDNSYGNKNPLYTASICGDINTVRSLMLDSKVDVNLGFSYEGQNYSILPELAKANLKPESKKTIFELLISSGADVNAKDFNGLSSLCYLQIKNLQIRNKSPKIIAIEKKANIDIIDNVLIANGAFLSLAETTSLKEYEYSSKRQGIDDLDRKSFKNFTDPDSDSDSGSGSSDSSLENTRKRIMYKDLSISKYLRTGY